MSENTQYIISYGILIAIFLFCIWHGIKITIGNKVSLEWYPAKRLFNKETIGMNGDEFNQYLRNKAELEKDEKFYNDLKTGYQDEVR